MPRGVAWIFAACVWAWSAGSGWGQVGPAAPEEYQPVAAVDEIDQATRAHLEQAQQFLSARQWADAVDALRRVMETDGERLIALTDAADGPFTRYVTIQRYGQALLSRWSVSAPEAVQQYRRNVDGVAERLWRSGAEARDAARLRDVAESYFMSSVGDEAAALLGEILFERGDFVHARLWWERLHPAVRSAGARPARPLWLSLPAPADDEAWSRLSGDQAQAAPGIAWLAYPDSSLSLAEIRARLALVSIAERSWARAERELELLRRWHPDETGTLAGSTGKWVELLAGRLEAARVAEHARRPATAEWPTFAGGPDRSRVFPRELDIGGAPLWRISLPRLTDEGDRASENRPRLGEDANGLLAYFPIVLGRSVLVAEPYALRALDLYSGRPLFAEFEPRDVPTEPRHAGTFYETPQPSLAARQMVIPHLGVPRLTLTGHGPRVFARLGTPATRWRDRFEADAMPPGVLVGVDLAAQGRLLPAFPLEPDSLNWSFEGTPLCDGRRLYVALRNQDEIRIEAHVAAYDLASGRLMWRRALCSSEPAGSARWNEITHSLLTLQQDTLYVNTNLGVAASLDARDGRLHWLTHYPRRPFPARSLDRTDLHFQRSLTPAVLHRDLAIFAPADCDRIFALDAASGQLLWTTPPGVAADAVHLLGVAQERLLASGDYLYWFDVLTGELQCQFPPLGRPEPGYARPSPRGYGRGLLAGQDVYWPTHEALYLFRQAPERTPWGWRPQPAGVPRSWSTYGVKPGNLVAAGHVLLVAGADELAALRAW